MLQAITHCLRGLLRFSGRDSRTVFDRYFMFVLAAWMVIGVVAFTPMAAPMDAQMRAYARTHPGQVVETYDHSLALTGPHPDLHLDTGPVTAAAIAMTMVAALLLAAAVARRLHDSDRSARWGLLPLPALVGSFALSADDFSSPDAAIGPGLVVGILAIGGFGLLHWMLRREGTPGLNRFGPAPAA